MALNTLSSSLYIYSIFFSPLLSRRAVGWRRRRFGSAEKRNRLLNAVRGGHIDFIGPSNPKKKRRRESLRRDVVDGGRDLALETRHERRPQRWAHARSREKVDLHIYLFSFFFFPFSLKFD